MTDIAPIIADMLATAATPCVTSSFQAEDVVLVHLLREVKPDIPVLFLETFHHFPQTLTYRDEIASKWQLNLINLRRRSRQSASGRPARTIAARATR